MIHADKTGCIFGFRDRKIRRVERIQAAEHRAKGPRKPNRGEALRRVGRIARTAWRSFAAVAFLFMLVSGAYAQVDTGSVQGQVTDASGSVIPNALVTLRNEGTDVTQSTHADEHGNYSFSPVRIGVYTISAEMQGFQRAEQEHVRVDIQQQLTVPFTLKVGSVQQSVVVSSATIPLLQTQNASVGQVVGTRQINNLPLNGRNYYFLAQLAAGVTTGQQGTRNEDNNGRFVTNGLRATQNDYLLDEIDNNSSILSIQNGKDYVIQTPVDALADFKIQTNNYNAEFGRAAGAVLNATVKSGTNQLHGDVWEFIRNDKLDGNDYFLNHAREPRERFQRNQFGFTLGGPVILPHIYNGHNRTFFFGDYEGTRINQSNPITGTVPTLLERNSNFTNFSDLISLQSGNNKADPSGIVYPLGTILDPATTKAFGSSYVRTPFAGNIIPAGRIDPTATALLDLLPPPTTSALESNYVTDPIYTDTYNSFDIRIDQVIGSKDYLFGRYSYNGHTQNHPGPFTDYGNGYADGGNSSSESNFFDRAQNVSIGETHTFSPTLINDFRIGVNREHVLWLQPHGNTLGIPQQFGIQGVPQYAENGGLPQFFVGSLTQFGSFDFMPSDKYGTTPQLNDDLTIVRGAHTIKLGYEQQLIYWPYKQPPESRGSFTFSGEFTSVYGQTDSTTGIAQMLLNPTATSDLAGANQVTLSNFIEHSLTNQYLGAYVQDDWRATEKLTLNLGLRYDLYHFMHEQHGQIANFIPGPGRVGGTFLATPQVFPELPPSFLSALSSEGVTGQQVSQSSLVHVQHLTFAPRIGFADHLTDRLVVRGGYGLFYGGIENIGGSELISENFPIEYTVTRTSVNAATPLAANNSLGLLETTFQNLSIAPATVSPSGLPLIAFQQNDKVAYAQGYNLSLQYQINQALTLTGGYVGSVVRHIESVLALNSPGEILPPTVTTTPYLPYQDTALSGDDYTTAEGSSNFNAFQATLEQHTAYGLTLLTNFAWQKTLTDARDPLEGDIGSYRAPFLPNFGIGADLAKADFDVRRIFHFSGIYDLPYGAGRMFGGSAHGVQQAVLGGWSTNFIATAQDGQPFTVSCTPATSAFGCFANLVSGVNPYAHSSVAHFVNVAAFSEPPTATAIGQTNYAPLGGGPTQASGPPYRRVDISFFKQFNFTGRIYSEFRAEIFNITNTPNFALPSTLTLNNSTTFGQITATRDSPNDPREIQFALKIYW